MNNNIKHDQTLPRVSNIECPNKACPKPKESPNEVIVIKYDQINMGFIYCCEHCDQFWIAEKK
jgi:hypothetical protein